MKAFFLVVGGDNRIKSEDNTKMIWKYKDLHRYNSLKYLAPENLRRSSFTLQVGLAWKKGNRVELAVVNSHSIRAISFSHHYNGRKLGEEDRLIMSSWKRVSTSFSRAGLWWRGDRIPLALNSVCGSEANVVLKSRGKLHLRWLKITSWFSAKRFSVLTCWSQLSYYSTSGLLAKKRSVIPSGVPGSWEPTSSRVFKKKRQRLPLSLVRRVSLA